MPIFNVSNVPAATPISDYVRQALRQQSKLSFPDQNAEYELRRLARQGNSDDPVIRALQIEAGYQASPGRAEGGTGRTGLASNDAKGYSRMLNERREYDFLLSSLRKQLGLR